jgi:glycerol uptake facilitator-like aquaporin
MGYYKANGMAALPMGRYWWVYIFAPTLGGVFAAFFIKFIHLPNLKHATS